MQFTSLHRKDDPCGSVTPGTYGAGKSDTAKKQKTKSNAIYTPTPGEVGQQTTTAVTNKRTLEPHTTTVSKCGPPSFRGKKVGTDTDGACFEYSYTTVGMGGGGDIDWSCCRLSHARSASFRLLLHTWHYLSRCLGVLTATVALLPPPPTQGASSTAFFAPPVP